MFVHIDTFCYICPSEINLILMKKHLLFLLAIFAVSCTTSDFHDNHVIAHRGAWKDTGHPQNSLASFKAAAELGCHGSECDVWLTADDSLVVYHDATREGQRIDTTCYAQVVSVPLKNGEKIPTLREYITCSKEYPRTKLIIDLKTHRDPERTWRMYQLVDKLVKEMGYEPYVEYLVGYFPAYDEFVKLTDRPAAYLGRYKKELPEMHPDTIAAHNIKYLDYQDFHYNAHPEWVETFLKNDIHLNVWTVNDEESMRKFLDKGFSYITTDHPALLLSIERQ